MFGPLPNVAFAKNMKKESRSVFIRKKGLAKKDKSYLANTIGDQESMPTPKKGFISGKVGGKAYYTSWSENVKVEGKNVWRHVDRMRQNCS